ncbi:hypothetical protein [Terribacillus saccharophilus]|uniref:hypothetical protein n=1 Tax=Terribacillus saccharophilus TaxID=361277 RepID=UPI002989AB15|nr:hypothetical protein [Terribacillus saccharophilus]MCM3227524.1 hypothetical protein [Terribacillus saccharophilus]
MDELEKKIDLTNKLQYVNIKANSLEHYVRNSIPLELLMRNEIDGLGHLTISDLLDVLQNLFTTGQADSYEVLANRKKPVRVKNLVWQLKVHQSNKTDHDWIHPKSKFHAFINNNSLCGKYGQDTDFFETTINEDEVKADRNIACKKCYHLAYENRKGTKNNEF